MLEAVADTIDGFIKASETGGLVQGMAKLMAFLKQKGLAAEVKMTSHH